MGRIHWKWLPVLLLAGWEIAQAARWRISPYLTLRQTYSDNINLDSGGGESAWLTEFNPAISISNLPASGGLGGGGLGGGGLGGGGLGGGGLGGGGLGGGGFGGGGFGGGGFGGGGFGGGGFGGTTIGAGGFGQGGISPGSVGRARFGANPKGRLHFNLNYRMQNIFSTQKGRGYDLRHQLQSNALAEVIENSVFVQARASAGQTLIDPHQRQFSDNLSNTGNRADFYTFGVSPYWRPHWGGYAEGEFRLGYNYFTASDGGASTTHAYTQSAILQSGSRFRTLTWQFGFRNEHDERNGAANVDFRNAVGRVNYRLLRKFSTFVQAGWVDNDFASTTNNNNNGFFYTVGATWSPSRLLTVEGGYGNNLFATVILEPTRRTRLQGTYRHNDVGSLTGDVFQGSLSHRGRHTTWRGYYLEETTTTQRVLLQQQVIPAVDAAGNPLVDPATQQPLFVPVDLPALVDEVFVRKRFELDVTRNFARHALTLRVYRSRRIFQVSRDESTVLGLSGSWRWQGGRRTTVYAYGSWQRSDAKGNGGSVGGNGDSTYWTASLRLNRRITRDLNAYLEYRHQRQKGNGDFDYRENRILAALTMRF